LKIAAFWDIALCSLSEVDWHFRGSMHLWNISLLQQDYTALYPNCVTFTPAIVRTWNLTKTVYVQDKRYSSPILKFCANSETF
jgi:hypothetical protein